MLKDNDTGSVAHLEKLVKVLTRREIELTKTKEELENLNLNLEKKVEERTRQLKEAQEQLIQSAKMATIGTLAGGVAHEINNPLGAILTNTQMLLREIEDPDKRESLELIEEGTRRCRDIVTALLKYSRKPEVDEFKPLNLNDIIDDACNLLQSQLSKENIKIERELSEIPSISGNANELPQVFTNLILNARDAIKRVKGHGKITFRTYGENETVVVEVTDDGCGIIDENINKIFDPFFTTKDVGEGTGLGLSIAYKIIEKHNGEIKASSNVGEGTTFIIRFPGGAE